MAAAIKLLYYLLFLQVNLNLAKEIQKEFLDISEQLQRRQMWNVYELELSIIPVLLVMERKGLVVDVDELGRVDRLMSVSQ